MRPSRLPFTRFTQRSISFRLFQLAFVAFFCIWLVVPQQVWAGCACSEVAVGQSSGSRVNVEKFYGALTLKQTDVDLPGYAGVNLTRTYDSLRKIFGMFGFGWGSGDYSYLLTTSGDIKVNLNGRGELFTVAAGYANTKGTLQLTFLSEDELSIENKQHDKWFFSIPTRACTRFVDHQGNAALYDMTITNKFVGVVDGTNAFQEVALVNKITYADNREMVFEYTSNLCTRVISPDGRTNQYSYTDGLLTGVTRDDGMVLDYGYHTINENGVTKGWLTSIGYASGAEVNIAYNGEFDTTNKLRVVELTGPHGYHYSYGYATSTDTNSSCGCRTSTIVTDSLNRDTVYTYEENGTISRTTNALGYASTTFFTNGLTRYYTDNRGNTNWYVYDLGNTNVVSRKNLLSETNALGKAWNYVYTADNLRTLIVNPLSHTNSFGYDSKRNLLSVTNAVGQQVVSLTYSTNGLLSTVTDGRGNTTTYFCNNLGLITNTLDAASNSWAKAYDDSGNLMSTADPLGNTIHLTYNTLNKPVSITDALGHVTVLAYDEMANRTNVTDAAGNSASFYYDQLQRSSMIRDALGHETRFAYDPASNLVTMTNALNQVYSYGWDAVNQTKTLQFPDGSKESYAYDPNGNLTVVTNRSGRVSKSVYDAGNRLTKRTLVKPGDDTVFDYDYDAANRLVRAKLLNGTNLISVITNHYDKANRLTSQRQDAYLVDYGYDANNNLKKIVYPSGSDIRYTYNKLNRISGINLGTNGVSIAEFSYDAAGRLKQRKLANGVERGMYRYNEGDQITNMVVRAVNGGTTNKLWLATYGYDSVGNRMWAKHKDGRGDVYQYDATYQLTGVRYDVKNPSAGYTAATGASRTVTYTYDALGNRVSMTDNDNQTFYTVNSLNQYTLAGSTTYTYDDRGNLISDGLWTYSYDHDNRLLSANKTGTTVAYVYDAFGRRISKVVNGVTTRYVYAGMNLVEERDGSGVLKAEYAYTSGVDKLVRAVVNGLTYYVHQDMLGNVVCLTNDSGQLVEQYTYDAFGRPTVKDAGGNTLSTSKIPFLFTGREYDWETGLYQYRARDYHPDLGRFLQPDPLGFASGDPNLYRYCVNNPVILSDPLGLMSFHWYGNYGGPGWTNGRWESASDMDPNEIGPPTGPDPIDEQDACYMEHDRCFARCKRDYPCDEEGLRACKRGCDDELQACLRRARAGNNGGCPVTSWLASEVAFNFTNLPPPPPMHVNPSRPSMNMPSNAVAP
jgi:RHS repeat-associated protein